MLDLIHKNKVKPVATATVATLATHRREIGATVANPITDQDNEAEAATMPDREQHRIKRKPLPTDKKPMTWINGWRWMVFWFLSLQAGFHIQNTIHRQPLIQVIGLLSVLSVLSVGGGPCFIRCCYRSGIIAASRHRFSFVAGIRSSMGSYPCKLDSISKTPSTANH